MTREEDSAAPRPASTDLPTRCPREFTGAVGNALLATLSGVLTSLAFPPLEWWWVAWFCLVPLLIALQRTNVYRASAWLGLLFGVVLCACSLHWMTTIFGSAAISLFVIASLPWALFGLVYRALCRDSSPILTAFMTPVLWIAAEWLRCEGWYFRFSWLQLGFTQVTWYAGLGFYPLIGVYGVTFLIVFVNGVAADLLIPRRTWSWRFAVVACIALMLAFGSDILRGLRMRERREIPSLVTCVVQDETGDLNRLKELTAKAADESPRLIVWPECAVAGYPLSDTHLLHDLQQIARRTRSVLVLGCKEEAPNDVPCDWLRRRAMMTAEGKLYYNTALVLGTDGEVIGRYHKTHPVQFFSDGVPGRGHPSFSTPVGRIGVAICYDFDYASTAVNLVQNGAHILVVPTFDAMEWSALQHIQHSRIAHARAAEVGRWVVCAASSGISQIIGPDGEVTASLPVGVSGSMLGSCDATTEMTPYVRALWRLPLVCVTLSLAWLVWIILRSRMATAHFPKTKPARVMS